MNDKRLTPEQHAEAIAQCGWILNDSTTPYKFHYHDLPSARINLTEIAHVLLDLTRTSEKQAARITELSGFIDTAEESIYAAMSHYGWGKSTHEHHASRVTFLCNLYLGSVDTIRQYDDKCGAQVKRIECAEKEREG